ncbi:hypothetical protein J6590_043920 [Homalodisca vitripennis]|nr:hypothetical protein J6590_043920 [Homalodisca vitripennis]
MEGWWQSDHVLDIYLVLSLQQDIFCCLHNKQRLILAQSRQASTFVPSYWVDNIRTSAQTPMVNKQEMLICKNRATIDLAEAWSMSWREKNIKTEEQGGEVEVEAGNSKSEVRECLCSCAEKYL